MIIPPGYYSSIDDVIAKMNELVDIEKGFKDNVKFSYDSLSRKVTVHLQITWKSIWEILDTCLAFNLHPELFQRPLLLKEKRTWNTVFTTCIFTATL